MALEAKDPTLMRTLQGRYRLEERIAAGGMGAVYAATDERLERRVAVKLPNEVLFEDRSVVERFRREAHAVAALSHPYIAQVFDYGEEDDRPFLVMELVSGQDLSKLLAAKAPLDVDGALWIATQVAAALGCAHSKGIVHRDVKPANIIVCNDGLDIKVTDFGIARSAGNATLTGTGNLFGTAEYLSPEQAMGLPATPRSDLYSLGIVLYEMLTGQRPFGGESLMGIVMQRLNNDVPSPSAIDPRLPATIDPLIARACARDANDRFADAGTMIEALRAGLGAGSPRAASAAAITIPEPLVSSVPEEPASLPTTPLTAEVLNRPTLREYFARRHWVVAALATLGLALVLTIAVSTPDETRAKPPKGRDIPRTETDGGMPAELNERLQELERLVEP